MKSNLLNALLISTLTFPSIQVSALEIGDMPWITWGESSYTWSDSRSEEGSKLDGFFKQGYVTNKFGNDWALTPYVAIRGTISKNHKETWNNKIGPWVGIETRKPIDLGNGKWADVSIGLRAEYYTYFSDNQDSELRGLFYVSFGAGGSNW